MLVSERVLYILFISCFSCLVWLAWIYVGIVLLIWLRWYLLMWLTLGLLLNILIEFHRCFFHLDVIGMILLGWYLRFLIWQHPVWLVDWLIWQRGYHGSQGRTVIDAGAEVEVMTGHVTGKHALLTSRESKGTAPMPPNPQEIWPFPGVINHHCPSIIL